MIFLSQSFAILMIWLIEALAVELSVRIQNSLNHKQQSSNETWHIRRLVNHYPIASN